MRYRMGVDIGGTFTDFALYDDDGGPLRTHKQLTTPDDPSRAVIDGVARLAEMASIAIPDVESIVHGTTLVTNAVIERKGVPTAMLVTRGFRDVLDIGLESRYELYDLKLEFPVPVVPRHRRFEVNERLGYDGKVMLAPDYSGLDELLSSAIEYEGVQAVAVCFLHSYVDSAHEDAASEWLAEHFPDLAVSTSADVFPFMREYERWTTACINAYVRPVVDRYIDHLERGLAELGFSGTFLIMSSSGGTLTPNVARRFPIRMLESGPAAGALMSSRHGAALGLPQLLSFDMGGTTAKGCIVQNARPLKHYHMEVARLHEFKRGSGLPVGIPVIDMIEIGAGGGSLAAVDERGTLRVGPGSAGADPGPACYSRGGRQPTLTDANLVLGYLAADSFLGGRMALDGSAAHKAINAVVATPLGVSVEQAAWGIHEVINEDVARAFRVHASERGVDYRGCSMVAFGGSGPLHAVRVAHKLRIPRVVCPWGAGVMSAFGLLASPVGFEVVRSYRVALDTLSERSFAEVFARLIAQASGFLAEADIVGAEVHSHCRLDMRYQGQGYEVEVELPSGPPVDAFASLRSLFHEAYARIFGMSFDDRTVEIVAWKVDAQGPVQAWTPGHRMVNGPPTGAELKGHRRLYVPERADFVDCAVYDRYALAVGSRIQGPALVEENESTCVLGIDDVALVDARGNLVIELGFEP